MANREGEHAMFTSMSSVRAARQVRSGASSGHSAVGPAVEGVSSLRVNTHSRHAGWLSTASMRESACISIAFNAYCNYHQARPLLHTPA